MEFLRKHYEKVILSIVLLLLAIAAAYLPFRVAAVNKNIANEVPRVSPKKFELDLETLSTNESHLQRALLKSPLRLSDSQHNLFNPVGWERTKEGNLRKDPFYGRKGPEAVIITQVHPLYFEIVYEQLVQDGESVKYQFSVKREADSKRSNRRLASRPPLGEMEKNDIFILKEVRGNDPVRPEGFVIDLLADNREVFVSVSEPYSEVAGYAVDLVYPPENNKKFNAKRRGDKITIARRAYEIVVVQANEVVLKDPKTTKQTTVVRTNVTNVAR